MSATIQTPLEATLIALWERSELYAAAEIRPHEHGTLYTAWDIDQSRICTKFIVNKLITKAVFDDLSIDLALLLHAESNKMRDAEIANGNDETEAAALAIHYGPYYMDVYLLDTASDIRRADLLGVYAPELFLHFVPNNLVEGGAA
jgi:hypothetical protein